ncbi:MAG: SPOR domain-containing protein [Burkholderiaceae bacterium]
MPETSSHASAAFAASTVLDQSTHSHIDKLYRAAVGPIQTDYYLPLLSRFEAYGRASPSWNAAACACTLNWMVFRGLWLPALLYLGTVTAAVAMVWLLIAQADPPMVASMRWSLWAGLATLALLVPGFFGNAWLYRAYRQRVDQALAGTNSLRDACTRLARQSSSRRRLVAIAIGNLALAAMLALGFWPTTLPTERGPRASGAVENMAPPASASATAAAAAQPAEAVPPIAPPQAAASAVPSLATAAAPSPSSSVPSAPVTGAPTVPRDHNGPFLINVGLFAQPDNAQRVLARLVAAGLPATSTVLETGGGPRTRVRAGPFTSRKQAETAAQRIRALQLDAIVIRQ